MFLATILFLSAAADPESADDNSVASEMISQFETVCSDLSNPDTLEMNASKNGWQTYVAKPETSHAKLNNGMRQVAKEANHRLMDFSKTISRSEIVLSVSNVSLETGSALTCRMHHYSATEPLDESLVTAIVGANPVESKDDTNLVARVWVPGLASDHSSLQTLFIPADSPLVNEIHLKGAMLVARKKKGLNQ